MKLKHIRKIAVLRANALGDFIFILPAMEALRAAYPEAEIVLLGRNWHAEFLAGRPGPIDRAIVIPPSRGLSREEDYEEEDPAELDRFFAAMATEQFDLAFQLHGGGRYSNPFIRRLGARMTAGLATPDAAPLDRIVPYIYFQPEILRYLEVVGLVGATTTWLEPRLCVTAQDLAEACRLVPELADRPVVALHPGATALRRRWPVESFAAVGEALRAAGAHVVVTGVDAEKDIVAGVVEAMQGQAQNLCGQLSLGGLAGLLSRCRVVVSNDSGPLHLAAAVGTATVGIYWCGNLINYGPLTRVRHRPLVSWRLNCPLCGRNCIEDNCDHSPSFVADISVEEVTLAGLDLLSHQR
ncbi:MAG: glycosyltransferase family 9 protein [Anaerolineales bacterium]|nr:glycosyltransferase family 9 protein [Anaerolineales bacterium]